MPNDNSQERQLAMLAHLLALFTHWLGPLIVWLTQKDQSRFVGDNAKEALNFQLTLLIVWFVLLFPSFILFMLCIGYLVVPVLYGCLVVLDIVFCIIAAIEANKGNEYRYPFNLRLIR